MRTITLNRKSADRHCNRTNTEDAIMKTCKRIRTALIFAAAGIAVVICTAVPASAGGTATEVVLEDSFENPDVSGRSHAEPAGWLQTIGHPGYVGLEDEENGQYFTTAYGTQVLRTYYGTYYKHEATCETTSSILSVPVEENTTYTLTFNVCKASNCAQGDYRAEFLAIDDSSGAKTLLTAVSGSAFQADMSETGTLEFTTTDDHSALFGQRFAVSLRMDPDSPDWHYKVFYDNVRLTRTCLPSGASSLILIPGTDGGGCEYDFQITSGEARTVDYARFLNAAEAADEIVVAAGKVIHAATGDICSLTTAAEADAYITYNDQAAVGERFGAAADKEEHPMIFVSWFGAAAYCNWKSGEEGLNAVYNPASGWTADMSAAGYRLPTEAEWYKAAGWDPETAVYFAYGNSSSEIAPDEANYLGSSDTAGDAAVGTVPYASYPAFSPYELYDTSGNVWEWCQDVYSPENGTDNVKAARGGSWGNVPEDVKTTSRIGFKAGMPLHSVGFRVVLPAAQQ